MENQIYEPSAEAETAAAAINSVDAPVDPQLDEVIHLLRSDPEALARVISQLAPDDVRQDGWTPFCRRLFLQVLSETGRVTLACDYAQLSKQSAYALRARDPVFAAGWDAACELARAPLADALYERALDGTTDTITKDGEVVATRHRHDSRLSIAVLNRLDKRCDRAVEQGSKHLALVARWDDWLRLVGKGEDQAAADLLDATLPGPVPSSVEGAPHGQAGQLPLGENPTGAAEEDEEIDLSDRFWDQDEMGEQLWMTDLPPPPGFTGYQSCEWGDPATVYERECTKAETALLVADAAAARAIERAEEEALRDAWFDLLRAECGDGHPGLDDRHATLSGGQCRSGHGPAFSSSDQQTRQTPAKGRGDGPFTATRTPSPSS